MCPETVRFKMCFLTLQDRNGFGTKKRLYGDRNVRTDTDTSANAFVLTDTDTDTSADAFSYNCETGTFCWRQIGLLRDRCIR